MMTEYNDSSESGFLTGAFEDVSQVFTDVEVIATSEVNVVAKAKRYGRWWLLKGLRAEVAASAVHQQRLRKELEILMQLQHPGVVTAYGLEEVEGMGPCIVMDYVDGLTLTEWLQGENTKEGRRRVARELTETIGYIHSKGIVHRDLKPSNIIVTHHGERVVLIDFGLADTDSYAILKQPAGTLKYMAPEQMENETADARNDIYSLGMVLRQMDLGRSYNHIIKRCLLPIDDRFQNVKAMQQAMERRRSLVRRWTAMLSILLLLTAMGVLLLLGMKYRSQEQRMKSQQLLIDTQQTKIEQQRQKLDSMQHDIVEHRQVQTTQGQAIESLAEHVDTVADYQQRQEAKKAEMLRREQSQQRMSVAFMAGVDSLRKSVSESGIGAQERYDRGVHTIEQHVENRAYGLTDEEKNEVRVCLLSVLETMKKGWQD